MANMTPAKYTKQMSAMLLPEDGGEIGAWAEQRGVPHSQIMRELVEAALPALRRTWASEYGSLRNDLLVKHTTRAKEQGQAQLERRRGYDATRRARQEFGGEDAETDAA